MLSRLRETLARAERTLQLWLRKHVSLLDLVISVLGVTTSLKGLLTTMYRQPSPPTVAERVEELDRMRNALVGLDEFMARQQRELEALSETREKLEKQAQMLEQAAPIDRAKVEALLSYQLEQQRATAWRAYALSFVLGLFLQPNGHVLGAALASATDWMRGRVALLCDPDGFLGEAVTALRREAASEPLEALAEYIREHRSEAARQRRRPPRSSAGYITDRP